MGKTEIYEVFMYEYKKNPATLHMHRKMSRGVRMPVFYTHLGGGSFAPSRGVEKRVRQTRE